MHLPDEYLSPVAAIAFWSGTLVLAGRAGARLARSDALARRVPLMAALAALAFALRMVRFPVLGTAACGHLTGGLLVAMIVGPDAAFLTLLAVQIVQAVVFADGGLLAVGANAVNAALWPAFIGRPILERLADEDAPVLHVFLAAVAAAVVSLELGALGVTVAVGAGQPEMTTLNFLASVVRAHVSLGIVEGIATAALLLAARRLLGNGAMVAIERAGGTAVLITFGLSLFGAAVLSDFASRRPEWPAWSLVQAQPEAVAPPAPVVERSIDLQRRIALLPDYGEAPAAKERFGQAATSIAGLFGALASAAFALFTGYAPRRIFRFSRERAGPAPEPGPEQGAEQGAGNPYAPR